MWKRWKSRQQDQVGRGVGRGTWCPFVVALEVRWPRGDVDEEAALAQRPGGGRVQSRQVREPPTVQRPPRQEFARLS